MRKICQMNLVFFTDCETFRFLSSEHDKLVLEPIKCLLIMTSRPASFAASTLFDNEGFLQFVGKKNRK